MMNCDKERESMKLKPEKEVLQGICNFHNWKVCEKNTKKTRASLYAELFLDLVN